MSNSRKFVLQLAGNLCAPHKAFHKLQSIVLVGLDFCKAHAGVRRRRRCNFSETPPPIHLATADKPGKRGRRRSRRTRTRTRTSRTKRRRRRTRTRTRTRTRRRRRTRRTRTRRRRTRTMRTRTTSMRAWRRTRRRRNDFSICCNDIWWRFRDLRRAKFFRT